MPYHIPHHLGGLGAAQQFQPIGLRMPPIRRVLSGFGADPSNATPGSVPPVLIGDPNVVVLKPELGTGLKIAIFAVGGLLLAGVAWLTYKEVMFKQAVLEKGGGDALMKYELSKAAGTLAYGLTGGYKKNRKKSRKGKKSRSKF